MNIPRHGLDAFPMELLCNIFRLAIGREDTKRDRCRLMLVCHQWREYVEGSASLWTDISARDSATYVRRALERCKGATLNLHSGIYWTPLEEIEALIIEAGPHIARWRSVILGFETFPPLELQFAPLTTTQAPSLEILELRMRMPGALMPEDTITLFGGAPAPSTLKELALELIPVAIEPLNLSGLVSLDLAHVTTITTPELLEILHRSPSLETLFLEGDSRSRLVAIGSPASNIRPIELPKLDSLTLKDMDYDEANCILSNIRIPNRRCVLIQGDMSEPSAFFTSTIAHLLHTTDPTTDVPLSAIIVEGQISGGYKITFRGIEIVPLWEEDIQEMLRWLVDGLGSEAAECPVHLILDWFERGSVPLATVPPPLVVKHLSIPASVLESSREALYIAMVQRPDPASSGWLYPQLESLSVEFWTTELQEQLVLMLRSRYEGANLPGATEFRCPVSLRSVELRGTPRTEGLVEEIKEILGETSVFWVD